MVTATHLERILAAHRRTAAGDRRSVDALVAAARSGPHPRPFVAALAGADGLAVIAELKRCSPSRGQLDGALEPAEVARSYQQGGAACLSVLTDEAFFGGCAEDLGAARAACGLPVLRKDFTVSRADVCDARIMGADAVLLIVAALSQEELGQLSELAAGLGMAALVEVHDEAEMERAVAVGAALIGVNQRDLATFEVDRGRAERLRPMIPAGVLAVAESGIRAPDDARRLADAGYDAVLVGESLVLAGDRAAAVARLRAATGRVPATGRVQATGRPPAPAGAPPCS